MNKNFLYHSFVKFLIDYSNRLRRSNYWHSADNLAKITVFRINLGALRHHRLERLLHILLLCVYRLRDVLLRLVHWLLCWHLLILDVSHYRLVQVEAKSMGAIFHQENRTEDDSPEECNCNREWEQDDPNERATVTIRWCNFNDEDDEKDEGKNCEAYVTESINCIFSLFWTETAKEDNSSESWHY